MATGYHEVWVLTYHTPVDDDILGVYETLRQAMSRGDFYIEGDHTTHGTEFEAEWSRSPDTQAYTCSSVGASMPCTYLVRKTIFERIV